MATIRRAEAPGRYVDLTDPKNLDTLSHHPRVATHLGQLHQDGWIDRPLLDSAALRVSGPQGRALTQALSRAVYDAQPRPDGIRYRSRLDDAEGCWAVFGHVDVTIDTNQNLDPANSQHRAAVADIAALWHIPLPSHWQ